MIKRMWRKKIQKRVVPDPDHEVIEGAQDQVKNDQEVRRQDEEKQLRHPKSFVYKS